MQLDLDGRFAQQLHMLDIEMFVEYVHERFGYSFALELERILEGTLDSFLFISGDAEHTIRHCAREWGITLPC